MLPSLFRSSSYRKCFQAYCATCSSLGNGPFVHHFPLTGYEPRNVFRDLFFVPRTESMSRILREQCFDRRYLEEEIEKAFLCGLKQGRIEGYNKGFDEGELQGLNQVREQGYNDGFEDGEARGYENGYDKGYDKCKEHFDDQVQQAYEDGNQDGYKRGFQEGHDNCEEEFYGSTFMLYSTVPSFSCRRKH